MIKKIGLLWRTIRYLRPIQLYARLWFKYRIPKINKVDTLKVSLSTRISTYPASRKPNMIGPFSWCILNVEGNLEDIGWHDDKRTSLWRYNQHYFDDLNANSSQLRKNWHFVIIETWIKENKPTSGIGWDPYPTSLRIVNWIKWVLRGNRLSPNATHSLVIQARWLIKRLEWHLLGNHLFANAKALIFAGLFFDDIEAQLWLKKGMKILEKEIFEQILQDGGQIELTPMYHALALEDLLDLINICSANLPKLSREQIQQLEYWKTLIPKMLSWLAVMSHPDGRISFFNDAAFNIAPENEELFCYAERLGFTRLRLSKDITFLENSGYLRLQAGKATLIADFAKIGADYIPGHGHADTLSFELSIGTDRVFVNSGTSEYGKGKNRQRTNLLHTIRFL